jgi:hypothetical protein
MKHIVMIMLAFLSVSTSAWAATTTVRCTVSHFVRVGGTEIRTAGIGFRNGDPVNAATIESITIYDFFGVQVHESVAGNHPLNTSFSPPVNVTTVPPNAAYFLLTSHIWGFNPIPNMDDGIDGNSRGFNMTAVVVYSKAGNPSLFSVGSRARSRERIPGPVPGQFFEGAERTSDFRTCS